MWAGCNLCPLVIPHYLIHLPNLVGGPDRDEEKQIAKQKMAEINLQLSQALSYELSLVRRFCESLGTSLVSESCV